MSKVISLQINWQRIVCIFSGGCIEDHEELSIYIPENMVSLYCKRCGSLIRKTPIHDITNPKVLETVRDLMDDCEENNDD